MLNVSHVSKRYGKTLAVDDVSMEVGGGQIAVLMGPNGAGKSTLIKSIMGLLRFDGTITVGGEGNKTLDAKRMSGYIPEMPAVYDLLTVSEHLEFIRRAYRLGEESIALENELLEMLEMDDKRDKLGKELSKGMQQKLSILCALLPRPRVAVFDEPLVGLDPHAIKALKELFHRMRADGCAVLISTHMLDTVEGIWDEAYIMMHGKIVATQKNDGNESRQALETMFFEITEGRE